MAKELWFEDGLRFRCTRCGNCCGGGTGFVWIDDAEAQALAESLGLSTREFLRRYTFRPSKGGRSLREKANYDCIFYDREQGCTVYEQRPRQCRTWPFWGKVLKSRATWDKKALRCPGMNQGPKHQAKEILRIVQDDGIRP